MPAFAAGLGTLAALTQLSGPVLAQGPGGPPMDGRGGQAPFDRPMDGNGPMGNGPMGGVRGGQFPPRGPRPVTLATAPLSALVAGLDLKGAQQDKIAQLKQQWRQKREAAMTAAPETAAMTSSPREMEQQAAEGIQNVLTEGQKTVAARAASNLRGAACRRDPADYLCRPQTDRGAE